MDVRDDYYAALERTSSGALDITTWLAWFLVQIAAAIQSSETTVEAVLMRTRFWMRHSRTGVNERQLKALNRMLETLPQEFIGGMTLLLRGAGRSARYELADVQPKADRTAEQPASPVRWQLLPVSTSPARRSTMSGL